VEDIHVRFRIGAPLETVFDAVSDHERFLSNARTHTTIARAGEPDRNGRGCLREVRAKPLLRFVEEITAWERPTSFDYMVRECTLPLRHHGGRLTFTREDGGTLIDWTTRFEVPVPIVGGMLAAVAKRILARAFDDFLCGAKTRLEGAGAARAAA
jgi:hypothetical protein